MARNDLGQMARRVAAGSAAALLLAAALPRVASAAGIAPESVAAWREFRGAQPFQTQAILLTRERVGRPRTLIFSEPPPGLRMERVAAILSADLVGCGVEQWRVMSGGSVADIVCTLRPHATAALPDELAQLQIEAFGSAEFVPVAALPAPRRAMSRSSLDLHFSANDLVRWLTSDTTSFRSSPLSPALGVQDLLQGGVHGVFASADSRLVVWAVDRSASLEGARADIRKFAVRSDLVLGAVANQKTALIVGRGRIESLAHLPPLRSETVLLLAGSQQRQLAQSYERNDLLAGKSNDGNDRAPILLSPQLVDTEFGTLLNVADQLLKGWSMAGQTRYASFGYPPPRSYPFGNRPAPYVDKDRNSFLFNWNTDGASYRQQVKGLDVIVPQRTGSLSVIYGDPVDRPRAMEDRAYDYFSSSCDVTLARVVQYTLLFQIFRQLDLKAAEPGVSPRYRRFSTDLDQLTRLLFKTILSDMSDADVARGMRAYWSAYVARLPASVLAGEHATRDQMLAYLLADSLHDVAVLRQAERDSGGKVSGALAELAGDLRLRQQAGAAQKQRRDWAISVLESNIKEKDLKRLLADRGRGLRNSAMLQVALERTGGWARIAGGEAGPGTWNHTAYVVESQGAGDVTGGHNLDAPMIRFTDSPEIARGRISVTTEADGSILVRNNPEDADKLRLIARDVGTRKELSAADIESQVATALRDARPEAPVPLDAIRAVSGRAPDFPPLAGESSYRIRALAASERDELAPLVAARQQAIVMTMNPDGTFVLSRTGSQDAVEMSSMTAVTDALANAMIRDGGARDPVTVMLRGMEPEKAEAILSFVQSNLARYPKKTVDHVLAFDDTRSLVHERPALLNASFEHNGLRVDPRGIKLSRITGGRYDGYSRVEVPLLVSARAPWYLRLVFIVKDISAAAIDRLTAHVNSLLASLPPTTTPARVQALVRSQMLTDMKELNIDSILMTVDSQPTNKFHDVIVGESGTVPLGAAA